MVEVTRSSSSSKSKAPAANLFKFCFIMRGLPGSGKSTVAAQLAGERGVVLNLDEGVRRISASAGSGESAQEADSLPEIQKKHNDVFVAEIRKGTPIIVVDNSNIKESEYINFIEFAQQEHYIASVVTMPAPADLETAAQRSSKDVTASELTRMMSMYEPFSLSKLSKKGVEMHELSTRSLSQRMSPRAASSGGGPDILQAMQNNLPNRRSSSHFREMPANTITEAREAVDEEHEDSSEEESKNDGKVRFHNITVSKNNVDNEDNSPGF